VFDFFILTLFCHRSGALKPSRNFKRNMCLGKSPFGAHDPLCNSRLGNEERACDLTSGQAAELASLVVIIMNLIFVSPSELDFEPLTRHPSINTSNKKRQNRHI
jgi:hypothetical protein